MHRKRLIPALLLATGLAAAGGFAVAQQPGTEQNDAAAELVQARISLVQAITAAEQHAAGRATHAELENENGVLVYGVEVFDGVKTIDVKVHATNGKVVSAQPDEADGKSANGKEERDDD